MARRERTDSGARKRNVRRDERGRFVGENGNAAFARTISFGNRSMVLVLAVAAGMILATAGAVIAAEPLRRGVTRVRV